MIKNILTHWRTSLPGFTALVTSLVTLGAMIIEHTATQSTITASLVGAFTGLGLLFSQDYTQGQKAHQESQDQIKDLQSKVNMVPSAIQTGDTSQIQRAIAATPPVDSQPAKP